MNGDADKNHLLDGIAELMVLPIQEGQATKVIAEITLEVDQKDGRMLVSASINSPPGSKPKQTAKQLFESRYGHASALG